MVVYCGGPVSVSPLAFGAIMKFHPASQILSWCLMVVAIQAMSLGPLLTAAGLIMLSAFVISRHRFTLLLRRTRWILLSLSLIYSYSTPGQPLSESLGLFSPSIEGLTDGLLQLTRLSAALAGLAILLENLHRQQLIAGLYTLFAPLRMTGMSPERLAVRLALTLHYAEVTMLRGPNAWQDCLSSLFDQRVDMQAGTLIELPEYRFMINDALMIASAALLLLVAMQ
jgi:energy-coupling factor transporter transmembrane protein EcfT